VRASSKVAQHKALFNKAYQTSELFLMTGQDCLELDWNIFFGSARNAWLRMAPIGFIVVNPSLANL
jgi:hypothetical protein